MEEDRNDSGINSGSDFHSSSPGSENSGEFYSSPQNVPTTNVGPFYSTPMFPRNHYLPHSGYPIVPAHHGFNHPPTPPNSEPMASPGTPRAVIKTESDAENDTLTPCSSPNNEEPEDSLRRLQMTLEKNGLFAPSTSSASPKPSENSMDEESKSDAEEYDEQNITVPRVNSHGKVKTFKCKHCDFVAITKVEFWDHIKKHIPTEKQLTCPKCPFLTEYKHHLEYHLRNHFGSKPFKCDKCTYACVNKSMLNSHMKSHSPVYQYRCNDCAYVSKYCHSLKLHLRKYRHSPAMVLNPDGTPNPLPIIDVYGSRRGPKLKTVQEEHRPQETPSQVAMQHHLAQMMLNGSQQMQLPFPYPFLGSFQAAMAANQLLFPQALARNHEVAQVQPAVPQAPPSPATSSSARSEDQNGEVLDLSKSENQQQKSGSNRRKGRAFKLEAAPSRAYSTDDEVITDKSDDSKDGDTSSVVDNGESAGNNNNNTKDMSCQYCSITFGDAVLYTMHMGYHGYKNPFACNMCGEECSDKVSFFLHIARNAHS